MINKLAPIVIFIYNRPNHLKKTLENLMQCEGFAGSPVIIYADGAKNENEQEAVKQTRDIAKEVLTDHAEYHFSKTNKGLSESIIKGVTNVVNQYGRVIVLEDDLIVAPNFLTFMNEALERYAKNDAVFQVSGYQFGTPNFEDQDTALFLPFTVSWGWATWKRAWDQFDPNAEGWKKLLTDQKLRKQFNLDGVYDYSTMLARQMKGLVNSWAIRWYWSAFNQSGLTVFPPYSLVDNRGFDGSGTHGRGVLRKFSNQQKMRNRNIIRFPDTVRLLKKDYLLVKKAIWKVNGGWLGYLVSKLRKLFL
jgi:hypothetical protein